MLRLTVVAHPGARDERVVALGAAEVAVWVRARAVEGQANLAIERALAGALGLRPRQVHLIAGATSRRKIVEVDLPSGAALSERLLAHGVRVDRASD
jgi:uncharacterized protein YggU (UPF0235/DUF167 family)